MERQPRLHYRSVRHGWARAPASGGGRGPGGYGRASSSEERREAALEEQIAPEGARSDVLEDEISAELQRQEDLLKQIDSEEPAAPPKPAISKTPTRSTAPKAQTTAVTAPETD